MSVIDDILGRFRGVPGRLEAISEDISDRNSDRQSDDNEEVGDEGD